MGNIINIIYFFLILSVIIIVHELGHLIAAKKFGVYCKEFSIGMGPVIWQKQKGETAWSIRALPIGGYVAMAGENGIEGEDDDEDLDIPFERTINGIKPWKQIIVLAAGVIMNILLAWALFIGITAYQGAVIETGKPIIGSVQKDGAASKAGLKAGDEITKVVAKGHTEVPKSFDDIVEFLQNYPGKTTLTVLRDGKSLNFTLTPTYVKDESRYMLGVTQNSEVKKISLLESIPYGTQKMLTSVTSIFETLGNLLHGVGLNNLSGPVGIYQVTAQITKDGWVSTIALIGLLSVNVGIFNLLPIPILDGGRILIILIETLIGRKLNERVQNIIMMAGLLVIVGIMVFATWNDIARLL